MKLFGTKNGEDLERQQRTSNGDDGADPGTSPSATRAASAGGSSQTAHDTDLPIDPRTGQPIPPSPQPGYYPGYSTLSQQAFWDEATRRLVLHRVYDVPLIRFFTAEEAQIAQAVFDRIVPQDDRTADRRVPILNYVDEGYHRDKTPGYRYVGMPPDREAIRLGLKGMQAIARHLYGKDFAELLPRQQEAVLQTIHDACPPAGHEYWRQMDVRIFWLQLVGRAAEAYYAHPYAWDEIGFGGPAYPRGYMRLQGGRPEPWEVKERRYPWKPPPGSPSAQFKPLVPQYDKIHEIGEQATPAIPGQPGTH